MSSLFSPTKIWMVLIFAMLTACGSNGQAPDIAESEKELYNHLRDQLIQTSDGQFLNDLVEAVGDRKLVLMGEASHGTEEYYNRRAEFSKKLIEEKGFNFIAVEGDWAAIFQLNKFIKDLPGAAGSAGEVLRGFDRWPEWMWGNTEVEALAEWLREHNDGLPPGEKVGFYGIDVYGQWEALEKMHQLAATHGGETEEMVARLLSCYEDFKGNEWDYSAMVARGMTEACDKDLAELFKELESMARDQGSWNEYEYFRLHQKALVLKNSEKHVRKASTDRPGSWNARVYNFWQTADRLLEKYGPDSRGIVWAHNTHVGDASQTTIMKMQGQTNIGQISREEMGKDQVFILGFGTYTGKVNAGSEWGAPMQIMEVPESPKGSWEHLLSQMPEEEFGLLFDENDRSFRPLTNFYAHRAIGVMYNPNQEEGNYVPTRMAHRYDAFWFIRETGELQPIE